MKFGLMIANAGAESLDAVVQQIVRAEERGFASGSSPRGEDPERTYALLRSQSA